MNLPAQAFLEITASCNQHCPFCSCFWFHDTGKLRGELSADEWKDVASELIENGVRYIAVTGGEPTLRKDSSELFRHIGSELRKKYGDDFVLALFSNGKELSGEWLGLLAEMKAELYVSLPGLNTFGLQTGGEPVESFRKVMHVIYNASERGIRTSAGVTVTKPMLYELFEVCSYAVLSGAKSVVINLFKPSGHGLEHPELVLSRDDITSAADTVEQVALRCGGGISFGGEFPLYITRERYPHIHLENRCVAARGTFTVAPDGWIHVCEHDPEPLCFWRDWKMLSENPKWLDFHRHEHTVCPITDFPVP